MFKKTKRPAFRQRTRHSDSESDDPSATAVTNDEQIKPATAAIRVPSVANSSDPEDDGSNLSFRGADKPKSKLSFLQEDEEEDVFIVKKSVYSRRMEKNKQRLLKSKKADRPKGLADDVAQEEGQRAADTTDFNRNNDNQSQEEIIVCPEDDEDDDEEENEEPSQVCAANRMRPTADGPRFRRAWERGTIPDANIIFEVKKQRQKLARGGDGDDFIPLAQQDQESGSTRSVREIDEDKSEDGNLDDDDDDGGGGEKDRIQFGDVDYMTKEKKKFEERFRVVQEEESTTKASNKLSDDQDELSPSSPSSDEEEPAKEESEDEMDKWEREQIRKAVRLPNIIYSYGGQAKPDRFSVNSDAALINKLQVIHDNHNVVPIEVDQEIPEAKSFGSSIPAYISERNPEPDMDGFQDRIHAAQQRLESTVEENQRLYDRVSMDIRLADNDVGSYEADVARLTDDYNFYRQMFEYVSNLCDCINDKLPALEILEHEALESYRQYSAWKQDRHKNDIQDQNGISLYFIMNHKALCLQHNQITCALTDSALLDLYHFDGDPAKRQRCHERLKRLARDYTNDDDDDGDEGPEYERHQQELKAIRNSRLPELFADTEDDFVSVLAILKQFQRWKTERPETYRESFIPEFMPKLLTYHLRYHMVLWNVFDQSWPDDLFDLEPFRNLVQYCTSSAPVDDDLIPALVENTVFPKLIVHVDNVWNPLCRRQTIRLATFLSKLVDWCPTLVDTSQAFPILLQRIVERMARTIESDIFIPQMIPAEFFLPDAGTDHQFHHRSCYETAVILFVRRFFQRQYWQTVRMMENVCRFRTVIQEALLKDMAVEKICSRYLVMSIQRCAGQDPNRTMEMIEGLLPSSSTDAVIPAKWLAAMNSQSLAALLQQLADNSAYRDNPMIWTRLFVAKRLLENATK